MFPAERREVLEEVGIDARVLFLEGVDDSFEVHGAPKDDDRGEKGQPASPGAMLFVGTVADFAESVEEHGTGESVFGFAFVEDGSGATAEGRALEPLKRPPLGLADK